MQGTRCWAQGSGGEMIIRLSVLQLFGASVRQFIASSVQPKNPGTKIRQPLNCNRQTKKDLTACDSSCQRLVFGP
jgi:hypothetical protein